MTNLVSGTGESSAAGSGEEQSLNRARDAFEKAQQLFEAGKYDEAAAQFQAAYEARPFAQFLFNIGACHEKLKDYDHAIRQFQVVQTTRGAITLRVAKGKRFSDDTLQEVLELLRQYLGEDMQITVEFVDNVEMVRTGKRLATVSKLGIDFQNIKAS